MPNRFFINGGVNNNTNDTSNWSASSGGAGGASIPSSVDPVFLDGNSPNCIINATLTCAGFICTGYVNTLTFSANLTPQGNILFSTGMTLATTNSNFVLNQQATGSVTSNGKIIPVTVRLGFTGGTTHTLNDDLTCQNYVQDLNNSQSVTINGNNLNVLANLTIGTSFTSLTIAGTTVFNLTGTGTWSNSSGSAITNTLNINTAGTITLSGTVNYRSGTFTYTAGTVVATSSTFQITGSSVTTVLNISGITLNNFSIIPSTSTITLTSDVNVAGNFIIGASANVQTVNGFAINVQGNLTNNHDGNGYSTGTTEIKLVGTGNITNGNGLTSTITLNITINTTGLYTLIGDFYYNKGIFKVLTPDNFVCQSASIFRITNTNGNTCTIDGRIAFAGLRITNLVTVTLTNDIIITKSIECVGTAATILNIISNSPGTQRKITVQPNATIDIGFTNPTDINSGNGKTVYSFRNTAITNTINWAILPTEPITKITLLR